MRRRTARRTGTAEGSGTPPTPNASGVTRRSMLTGIAGLAAASTSGCLVTGPSDPADDWDIERPMSLSIKTLPADEDPRAILVARYLVNNLRAVGVTAEVVPMTKEELLRDVLLRQEFDLFLVEYLVDPDPDFLRPLLHSRFAAERGWQNPFGYANSDVDALLNAQKRRAGASRNRTLFQIQRALVRDLPFLVVAFPHELRAVRTDRIDGWGDRVHAPLGYLSLRERADATPVDVNAASAVRVTLTDGRVTESLNPIAAEFRDRGTVTGLLYDPLGRWIDGVVSPWLAESWTWTGRSSKGGPTADVTLREALQWHDGTPLSAADVAFTYRILADTALGGIDTPIPAPLYRGQTSLVDGVDVLDDRRVRFRFHPCTPSVAAQALTVPVLPEHLWESRTSTNAVAGFGAGRQVSDALTWRNTRPVGSGPLRFVRSEFHESLVLAPFEDHFLSRSDLAGGVRRYAGGFAFDRLEFVMVPSDGSAIEFVGGNEADATASCVAPSAASRIDRFDSVELRVAPPESLYMVGFNARKVPFDDPLFRRVVDRLLDREHVVIDCFDGQASPAVSPLEFTDALAPDLGWTDSDPAHPFLGENGVLDVQRARRAFEDAGYRYSARGKLLAKTGQRTRSATPD